MTSSGSDGRYYWCLKHRRVETGETTTCSSIDRLGPYVTSAEAEHALERVAQRNAEWEAEDARWNGE